MGGSPNKMLLFIIRHYDYEMCSFKRKMSAPRRLIDSKAWCPLLEILFAFYLKYYQHNGNTRQKHEE